MKYGYFDNENREYHIETPQTPLPWMNYMGTQDFFGMISNTGGGYCFMVDARKQRITRYRYNNAPMDSDGRYIYVREENGDIWSPSWMPVKKELDDYLCRHGMGYTVITGERNGLRISTRYFVPVDYNLEIWEMDIENKTNKTRTFKLFSYVEFCLWEALNDATNLQRTLNLGEVEVEDGIIYHKTEYRERRNHFAYFATSEKVTGFDTDRDTFLGAYRGNHEPIVVEKGQSQNSVACGWNPCGSHSIEITLKPGETKKINFLLGFGENPEDQKFHNNGFLNKEPIQPTIQKFLDRSNSEKAFHDLKRYWDQLLGKFQTTTPDHSLNTMVNIWNQYQNMITFKMSRSTSLYETGIGRGIGFRDACQDLFGVVHMIPTEWSRERILDLAAIQWRSGECYHQYQLLDKKGNADVGVGFNDDPCWLILATASYIRETGDWLILNEQAPFDNDPNDTASLYEHLKISFQFIINNLGPHQLPKIGHADWNDCLNLTILNIKPGDTFQADAEQAKLDDQVGSIPESLMIAAQFIWAGREFRTIAKHQNNKEDASMAEKAVDDMLEAIYQHGWDGNWFLRAYDRFGNKIGSKECEEGQIFIEPQSFMGMAKVGIENGMLEKAMNALQERLFTKHGVVVQQPAYSTYNFTMGEITSYPPGVKENAGVFCHPNGWVVIAECNLGRGDEAMKYYKTICPAAREDISDIHRCEPYCYAQMIAGSDSPRHGEAKNSWLTGTSSANFLGVSQYILGLQPDYNGLRIDPCIPKHWKNFSLKRSFRNATYHIQIENPKGINKGIAHITVDGKKIDGNLLPLFKDGKEHQVKVVMG